MCIYLSIYIYIHIYLYIHREKDIYIIYVAIPENILSLLGGSE